jgi:hypothetical protein
MSAYGQSYVDQTGAGNGLGMAGAKPLVFSISSSSASPSTSANTAGVTASASASATTSAVSSPSSSSPGYTPTSNFGAESVPVKRKPGRPKGSITRGVGKVNGDKPKRPVGRPRKDGLPAGSVGKRSRDIARDSVVGVLAFVSAENCF